MTVVPASLRALEDLEPIGGPQWFSFKVDSGSKRNPVISVEVDTTFPIAVFFTCDAKPNTSTCKTGVPTTNEELGAGCRSAVRTEPATALTKKTRVSLTTECERGVAYVWLGTDEGTERYYSAQMTVTP